MNDRHYRAAVPEGAPAAYWENWTHRLRSLRTGEDAKIDAEVLHNMGGSVRTYEEEQKHRLTQTVREAGMKLLGVKGQLKAQGVKYQPAYGNAVSAISRLLDRIEEAE